MKELTLGLKANLNGMGAELWNVNNTKCCKLKFFFKCTIEKYAALSLFRAGFSVEQSSTGIEICVEQSLTHLVCSHIQGNAA